MKRLEKMDIKIKFFNDIWAEMFGMDISKKNG
jgi:hypothetical protein